MVSLNSYSTQNRFRRHQVFTLKRRLEWLLFLSYHCQEQHQNREWKWKWRVHTHPLAVLSRFSFSILEILERFLFLLLFTTDDLEPIGLPLGITNYYRWISTPRVKSTTTLCLVARPLNTRKLELERDSGIWKSRFQRQKSTKGHCFEFCYHGNGKIYSNRLSKTIFFHEK